MLRGSSGIQTVWDLSLTIAAGSFIHKWKAAMGSEKCIPWNTKSPRPLIQAIVLIRIIQNRIFTFLQKHPKSGIRGEMTYRGVIGANASGWMVGRLNHSSKREKETNPSKRLGNLGERGLSWGDGIGNPEELRWNCRGNWLGFQKSGWMSVRRRLPCRNRCRGSYPPSSSPS